MRVEGEEECCPSPDEYSVRLKATVHSFLNVTRDYLIPLSPSHLAICLLLFVLGCLLSSRKLQNANNVWLDPQIMGGGRRGLGFDTI